MWSTLIGVSYAIKNQLIASKAPNLPTFFGIRVLAEKSSTSRWTTVMQDYTVTVQCKTIA